MSGGGKNWLENHSMDLMRLGPGKSSAALKRDRKGGFCTEKGRNRFKIFETGRYLELETLNCCQLDHLWCLLGLMVSIGPFGKVEIILIKPFSVRGSSCLGSHVP